METLIIWSFGILALILLHIILSIGPLARLDKRFLILLYNRRHLGVTMFFVAFIHGLYNILNFHTLGNENPIRSLFVSNPHFDSFIFIPFETFGVLALVIFSLMAFTSHDFWLKSLGPKVWKRLHMLVYVAYGLLVFHVLLGAIENESSWASTVILGMGALTIIGLHIGAGLKEVRFDQGKGNDVKGDGKWLLVGSGDNIPDNRALMIRTENERVAIFRSGNKVSAVSNFCRHQGGPLSEGKIVDGFITCPWHGYQYFAHNGCSPPPFTEKIETYNLKLEEGNIYLDPVPNSPGTEVEPLKI